MAFDNKSYHQQYYQLNKDKWKNYEKQLSPEKKIKRLANSMKRYYEKKETDPDFMKNRQIRANERDRLLKIEVLLHYSPENSIIPTCCCCKEIVIQFLTLDHEISIGTENRVWGSNQYRKVRMNGFPIGYKTLCINCNLGRHINGGICPHQEVVIKHG